MISLIATVLNEGESMHRLMGSLVAQTRLPDEIVMVDGGSRDDTVGILQSYADRLPIRVLVEPGCTISEGRNRAIAAAQGDIIAVTDAGVELAADWLEQITRPLIADAGCMFVGGFFQADYTTLFELAMSATVLPLQDEIHAATFLPSSRSVAFRKVAWQAVEGYPEWLDYCEDLVFDLRVKQWISGKSQATSHKLQAASYKSQVASDKAEEPLPQPTTPNPHPPPPSPLRERGGAFVFVPEAVVAFRPRGSLRRFFKQYYLYARGDGKADLWRKRHAARYLTYLVALPVVFLLGALVHPVLWLLVLPGGYVYLRQPYRRLGKMVASGKLQAASRKRQVARHQSEEPPPRPSPASEGGSQSHKRSPEPHPPRSLRSQPSPFTERGNGDRRYTMGEMLYLGVMVVVIRVVGDVAKMAGYPVGWVWRLRENPPDWTVVTIS